MPQPDPRTSHLPTAAIAIAIALLAASSAQASEERFRLLPGSVMQNDDSGIEGTQGFARGLGYEVMQGFAIAEGDMVLGRVDGVGRLEVPFRPRGLGLRNSFDRWPDGIIPYAFHPGISEIQQSNVEEALEQINTRTRIALVPADSPEAAGHEDYVMFEPSSGCASYVGRQLNEKAQSLWVADSCSVGSIVHEIAHAIGLFHEHTRPDRDNHVSVVWDEIVKDKAFNFEIYDSGAESWGKYDFGSIMHYGEYFFSKSGERTIVAPTNTDIGQRVELSATDIETIDRMYATDLALGTKVFESERGLEIDVSISNVGDLGARGLTFSARGGVGTDWLSSSAESGWDCLAHDEVLRCERSRQIEQASSRFTIVADPDTTGANDITFHLGSITLDTDLSNNGTPSAALAGEESGAPTTLAAALPDVTTSDGATDSSAQAASSSSPASTRSTTGANSATNGGGGGGGGASALGTLAVLGLLAGRRRRRSAERRP